MKPINKAFPSFLSSSSLAPSHRNDLFNSFNTVLDDFFNTSFLGLSPVQTDLGVPKINAYKVANTNLVAEKAATPGIVVDIFVPYLTKEFLDIDCNEAENAITITARSHQDEEISDNDYFVRQLSRSGFKRTFTFDKEYSTGKARADLKDGILRITVPVATQQPKAQGKKITIG